MTRIVDHDIQLMGTCCKQTSSLRACPIDFMPHFRDASVQQWVKLKSLSHKTLIINHTLSNPQQGAKNAYFKRNLLTLT